MCPTSSSRRVRSTLHSSRSQAFAFACAHDSRTPRSVRWALTFPGTFYFANPNEPTMLGAVTILNQSTHRPIRYCPDRVCCASLPPLTSLLHCTASIDYQTGQSTFDDNVNTCASLLPPACSFRSWKERLLTVATVGLLLWH